MRQRQICYIFWSPFFPLEEIRRVGDVDPERSRRLSPCSIQSEKVADAYECCIIVVSYECLNPAPSLLG